MKSIKEQKLSYQNLVATEAKLYCKSTLEIAGDGFDAGVESSQRWIPVEEDKPQEEFGFYKPVLVLNEKYGMCSSAAYKNGKFIPDNPVINPDEITHWRPIEIK